MSENWRYLCLDIVAKSSTSIASEGDLNWRWLDTRRRERGEKRLSQPLENTQTITPANTKYGKLITVKKRFQTLKNCLRTIGMRMNT